MGLCGGRPVWFPTGTKKGVAGSKWDAGDRTGEEVHMDRLRVQRVPVYRPKPLHRYGGAMPQAEALRRQQRRELAESARTAVIAVMTFPLFYLFLVLVLLAGGAR